MEGMREFNYFMFVLTIVVRDKYVNDDGEYDNDRLQLVNVMQWAEWVADTLADVANKMVWDGVDYEDVPEDVMYEICAEYLESFLDSKQA